MQMVPATYGAAGDPNLIRFDCLANLVMADHLIVNHHGQAGADVRVIETQVQCEGAADIAAPFVARSNQPLPRASSFNF